ncbi:histidinol dehydrogenase [bacterium]|nr:histidinol dehydrogenase [bacterium]
MNLIEIVDSSDFHKIDFQDFVVKSDIQTIVSEIIETVRKKGDRSLYDYTDKFDKVSLRSIKIKEEDIHSARSRINSDVIKILNEAIDNIRSFHENQLQESWIKEHDDGTRLGELVRPMDRAGLYIPGGKAFYPSTMIMNAVPAQIAGVKSIVVLTPPDQNGLPQDLILGICSILGINEIFSVGGAQAIAAMAYGTESIAPVCKITGPGNIFVAEAKRQVFGKVGIDSIAGPSEIVILHDDPEIPIEYLARDLLTQAEHDEDARAVLITDNLEIAGKVKKRLNELVPSLPRKEIIRKSLTQNGKIIIVKDVDEGIELVNTIAPEHLELLIMDKSKINKIRNAGAIFIGKWSSETVGDYFAGPNHTIPTGGAAKYGSPLSVRDFQKHSSVIEYSKERLFRQADSIAKFADLEGLHAHAEAVRIRKHKVE